MVTDEPTFEELSEFAAMNGYSYGGDLSGEWHDGPGPWAKCIDIYALRDAAVAAGTWEWE